MILIDVNVLVSAFRQDAPMHGEYRAWLEQRLDAREPVGLSELVLSGVLRVLTHPRVFDPPTPLDRALAYVEALRAQPNAVALFPGDRHWEIFTHLLESSNARGNLVADAYHAALAIEHGCEWVSSDRDFARFRELRWVHPLE